MKIGFDVAQTCVQRAGCAWYADSLLRAMVSLAPENHFSLYHQFGTLINESTSAGTEVVASNVSAPFKDITTEEARTIWHNPAELWIKAGMPDIVHACSFRAPKIRGAKLVFTVYDVAFWATPQYTTEDNRLVCQRGVVEALKNADGFIFISQHAHDEFERFLPNWLDRNIRPFVVTPLAPKNHGAASLSLSERSSPVQNAYWLAVGSLEPRKNYDTLLDALELYWARSERRLPLRIAGGIGWKSDTLHARIHEFVARGLVEYRGYVSDMELNTLYAGAEALIFPSWYEGFGLPVIEAMVAGCPVISSNRASLKEVGGDAAMYVDPARPNQIAELMIQLESNPVLRNQRGQSCRAQAGKFSWQQTAKQTLEFYHRLLNPS